MFLRYRLDMINWSTTIRQSDYTYFCKAAIEKYNAGEYPVWIVSDCRRKTDFQFFKENFGERVVKVRVEASKEARAERYSIGVKDMELLTIVVSEVGCSHPQ